MFSKCYRRFGVEIEFNAFDKLSRSVGFNGLPSGIYNIADILSDVVKEEVEINKWHSTNNNNLWVVKPDSSCGIEVCSPPKIHHHILRKIECAIDAFSKCNFIEADNRCSLHVHVEIEDFDLDSIKSLLHYWIIFEPLFFGCCIASRWMNNYCKPLSLSFDISKNKFYDNILENIEENKYYAINLCNYKKKKKRTVEFRIMGGDACLSSETTKNWCKLLLCFVEKCKENNGKVDFDSLNYKKESYFYNFLELESFFDSQEVKNWLENRINNMYTIHKSTEDMNSKIWVQVIDRLISCRRN